MREDITDSKFASEQSTAIKEDVLQLPPCPRSFRPWLPLGPLVGVLPLRLEDLALAFPGLVY